MSATAFQYAQMAFTLAVAFLSGLSACFTLWVIPILTLPCVPAEAKAAGLVHLYTLGGMYLQPSSRILGASAVALTAWSYAADNGGWAYELLCFGLLIPIAVWEVYMIFPINDRVAELDKKMQGGGGGALSKAEVAELTDLLNEWSTMHTVRWVLPGVAAVVSALALVR
ncbi:hypothetical protein LTR53_000139 [Teratosphaeriaceae sp. CCFEE 6253]|nr:hypothetical protein LTR53_000139 [Teratosphaeriaceae sp. CCFEE 6253]